MTKSQAHNEILSKYEFGLISLEEAKEFHRQVNRVAQMDVSWSQKQTLFAVWA